MKPTASFSAEQLLHTADMRRRLCLRCSSVNRIFLLGGLSRALGIAVASAEEGVYSTYLQAAFDAPGNVVFTPHNVESELIFFYRLWWREYMPKLYFFFVLFGGPPHHGADR